MKRISEKVKHLVDVRASANLSDFHVDPAATLEGYHFTDITADLMGTWIDRIANIKAGNGCALALAGFRGVGKSHFLAVLGALAAKPELRSQIPDPHVTAKAQRLSRRHGNVAYVRRGSGDSLPAELKSAIAKTLDLKSVSLSDSITELLRFASAKSADRPLLVLIDTDSGREVRVARDDGALLSEIAEAARSNGIFVGIALDDDIAGADGINLSIASNFAIEYLDQEHLYKIVNAYVFAKKDKIRPVLHDIYESYRQALPDFRWSEHRFSALYPLHPAIVEIAPFIRLYLHDFALLSFASEFGVRILGRPANSLIGLDEVFDSVEGRLRGLDDLKAAFAAFDFLDNAVIAKLPVMRRHEAKLILKGFFLVSLDDECVTAGELGAAMLIAEENGPIIETVLRSFAESLPDTVAVSEQNARDAKFVLRPGGEDKLKDLLSEAGRRVTDDEIESVLRRQTAEKFTDFELSDASPIDFVDCDVVWRGAIRRGEIIWPRNGLVPLRSDRGSREWTVFIRFEALTKDAADASHDRRLCEWKLGDLSGDDLDTIRRFHVLQTDADLRERYGAAITTAIHIHSIAVEKIWQRVFLEEARFVCELGEYAFTLDAQSSHSLSQLFSIVLAEYFESKFPFHPLFVGTFGDRELSLLIEHLLGGSGINIPEIQNLSARFALPLGLVKEIEGEYRPVTGDDLAKIENIKDVFKDSDFEKRDVIPLSELANRMQRAPHGLTKEAQYLVLAALVAQQMVEFVTSSGNRINHRSLDLQIVWDDIVGIARPADHSYSSERLLGWAALISGDASLKTLKSGEARSRSIAALEKWLGEWKTLGIVEYFDSMPDDKLNSGVWRTGTNVCKSFGAVETSVENMLKGASTPDKCLQVIADIFCDSEDEYKSKEKDLSLLREIVRNAGATEAISDYLFRCEPTGDAKCEKSRYQLIDVLGTVQFNSEASKKAECQEKWGDFKRRYVDIYAQRHDTLMDGRRNKLRLDQFLGSDTWSRFVGLSAIPLFGVSHMRDAAETVREMRQMDCVEDVRSILDEQPTCVCTFSLAKAKGVESLIAELAARVINALEMFSQKLLGYRDSQSAKPDLSQFFPRDGDLANMSGPQIQLFKMATAGRGNSDHLTSPTHFYGFEALSDLLLENELDRLQLDGTATV